MLHHKYLRLSFIQFCPMYPSRAPTSLVHQSAIFKTGTHQTYSLRRMDTHFKMHGLTLRNEIPINWASLHPGQYDNIQFNSYLLFRPKRHGVDGAT